MFLVSDYCQQHYSWTRQPGTPQGKWLYLEGRILCFLVSVRILQNSGMSSMFSLPVHAAIFLVVEGFPGGRLCEPGCGRVVYCVRAGSESQNAKTRPEGSSQAASHRHASIIRWWQRAATDRTLGTPRCIGRWTRWRG